jgi:N-acetylneuraminic acid mutarotase
VILAFEPNSANLLNAGYISAGALAVNPDRWTTRNTGPSKRWWHSAIWTGTEMIVWGGGAGIFLNDGGRYNPTANSWQPVSLANAPSGRWYHKAVWTGSEMLIWGGRDNFFSNIGNKSDGGRYNPVSNSWNPINTEGAPAARSQNAMIWTGTEMLVWGGLGQGAANLNTGGRYDPVRNSWSPISTNGAPQARLDMAAVWTGEEMIIWGGGDLVAADRLGQVFANGARYRPSADTWSPVSTNGAPAAGAGPLAVWTGHEMIVWGGFDYRTGQTFTGGARYNPATDTWSAVSPTDVLGPRAHEGSAVWTGTEMIIWGGERAIPFHIWGDGARYNPGSDSWTQITSENAPSARLAHTAVWTGQSMLVFGGYNNETGAGELNSNHSWTPGSSIYLYQRP